MSKLHSANLVSADRAMNERVEEYLTVCISKITDSTHHRQAVDAIKASIKGLENCRGSVISDADIDAGIAAKNKELEKLQADYKAACKVAATFVYTKEDLALYNTFATRTEETDLLKAVADWASAWKLDLTNTRLARDIVYACSGRTNATVRQVINSGCATMTKARSKKQVLDMAYRTLSQEMVAKGLKVTIPDDIKAFYAPKAKKSDAQ